MAKNLLKITIILSGLTMLTVMSSANAYIPHNIPNANAELFEDEEYVIYEPTDDIEFQNFSTPFN